MNTMTKEIYRVLRYDGGWKNVLSEEIDGASFVKVSYSVKSGGVCDIYFISIEDDEENVLVRVLGLVKVDEEKKAKMLPVLNRLNRNLRYVKFVIDEDGVVDLEYDFAPTTPDPRDSIVDAFLLVVEAVEEAYPELMRAVWGADAQAPA